MTERAVKHGEDTKIEVGYGAVVIDKLFGPTIFADLRVRADPQSGNWIIQRRWIDTGHWIEWCQIPGQIEQEFTEEDDGQSA